MPFTPYRVLSSIAILLGCAAFPARASDCVTSDVYLCHKCERTAYSHMYKDEICDMTYNMRRAILSVEVLEKPKHGVVGRSSNGVWLAYRPNPGYVGDDEYTEKVTWQGRNGAAHAIVKNYIKIVN